MVIKVKTLQQAQKEAEKLVSALIAEQLEDVKQEIDSNTPIDTGLLLSDTIIIPPKKQGNMIVGSVENSNEYGPYVEYGVQGRTYNYHKNKRIFYVGVGARMFTRAFEKLKKRFSK